MASYNDKMCFTGAAGADAVETGSKSKSSIRFNRRWAKWKSTHLRFSLVGLSSFSEALGLAPLLSVLTTFLFSLPSDGKVWAEPSERSSVEEWNIGRRK